MGPSLDAIRENLFPASHAAIGDWEKFPWHRDGHGVIQADKRHSSQALAIDVFGTIKVSEDRDRILSALARECGVPEEGPWKLNLEWTDDKNLLKELTPTQVDAIAFGARGILVFECKFKETGGRCSQPDLIRDGPHAGMRQCNGNYEMQTNPVNGAASRCALTGKGVRYWEIIPKIYGLSKDRDHRPCPFRGETYQWMRNVVLADRLASELGVSSAVIAAYAEAEGLHTAKKVRAGPPGLPAAAGSGRTLVFPRSYQSIVELAQKVASRRNDWIKLEGWVQGKIVAVAASPLG